MSLDVLGRVLQGYGRLVVAFSGGVDSGLLAFVANQVLGADRVVAVTAVSASLAPGERDDCRRLAEAWELRWREVRTDELARPDYVANDLDRCYHCKSELMDHLEAVAAAEGARIALGVNLDDLEDHRPGQEAARERGAAFPLVDAGFTKADVRAAAKDLGLDVWDKPAAACLASRIPYGTPVTMGALGRVARAEEALKQMGFRQLRVRHYGDLARIELPDADLDGALRRRAEITRALKSAGYRFVTLDLDGFRSGSLNPQPAENR